MLSQSEWDSQKDVIRELYLNQKYTLKELQERMNDAGFVATKSQYETKFKAWGFSKNASNIPAATWKHVSYKMAKRKRENEDSAVIIDDTEVDSKRVKKEISRHTYSTIEQIKLESIGAPSPPGPLVIVATPPSSQPGFSIKHCRAHFPWLAFVRSLNTRLVSLRQENETSRASQQRQSSSQSRARAQHRAIFPNHNTSVLDDWQTSSQITTGRRRWDLIYTILPYEFSTERIAGIEHSMSLLSTTSSHWVLKLLIYLASNNFLEYGDLDEIWQLVEKSGVKELATLTQSPHLGESSLTAALEYFFQAGVHTCRTDIVSWLLGIGVDPNRRIRSNDKGLHFPLGIMTARMTEFRRITTEYKPMVHLLLSRGALPLSRCCAEHKTAAHLAITDPAVDAETLERFLQAAVIEQGQERSVHHSKNCCREHRTIFGIPGTQQHEDEVLLRMDLLAEMLEKSSTSREILISPETLIQAVKSNNHRLIRTIHRHGLSMDCHGLDLQSPLAVAVKGRGSTVSLLMELGASPNYNPSSERNDLVSHALQTAVHESYTSYRAEIVQILIENGAKVQGSVSCGYENHQSLMDCALRWRYICTIGSYEGVIKALHAAGLPFPRDSMLWYMRCIGSGASLGSSGSIELRRLLISKTTDWTSKCEMGWTVLDHAVRTGMKEAEELIIKQGVAHSRKFIRHYCLNEPRHSNKFEALFGRFPTPRNDKQRRALLFYRIIATLRTENSYTSRTVAPHVRDLLEDYSKLPCSPKHEAYIILQACATWDKVLIQHALKLFPDTYSPAALEGLIWNNTGDDYQFWSLIKDLLERHLNKLSSLSWSQATRMFSQAVYSEVTGKKLPGNYSTGRSRLLEWFLEHGREAFELANLHPSSFLMNCLHPPHISVFPLASANLRNRRSWNCMTPLNTGQIRKYGLKTSTYLGHLVAHDGQVDQMRDLLHHGLQPNRRFTWAPTMLQLAVAQGDLEMSRQLLEEGAKVDARAPWRNPPRSTDHRSYGAICGTCDDLVGPQRGRNALQWAVEKGDVPMIELLLEKKAPINDPPASFGGATALQIACMQGYIDIAKFLIEKGADVNAAGAQHSGRTALEGAAELGRLDMVSLLLDRGCLGPDSSRMQYIRAVGFARAEAHHVVAMKLQEFGDWTFDDEIILNDIDLDDSDLNDCLSEDLSQDGEEISEADFLESDGSSRFSLSHDTDSESEFGDDDVTRGDEEALASEKDIPHRTVDEWGGSGTGPEPAPLQLPPWDDSIYYWGDDEAV